MAARITRRTFVSVSAMLLAGCGGSQGNGDQSDGTGDGGQSDGTGDGGQSGSTPTSTPPSNPAVGDVEQMGDLQLTSPAFEDGKPIPEKYGYKAQNVNPPLSIANVPPETKSMTLIMDDPDAVEPAGKVWLHWLVWNIPPDTRDIPEGWNPTDAVQGTNDFDKTGYGGPAPPDETHTYRFKLYALDTTLALSQGASKREVGQAMVGHVLAQTQLEGTYSP